MFVIFNAKHSLRQSSTLKSQVKSKENIKVLILTENRDYLLFYKAIRLKIYDVKCKFKKLLWRHINYYRFQIENLKKKIRLVYLYL